MKKEPLYLTIAQDIMEMIQNGTLRSGEQLMTEAQLCEKYHVSRMTANKALSALAAQGYISRTAGKGSFVLEPKVTKNIGTSGSSFSADMASVGKKAGAILMEYRVICAEEAPLAAEQLRLEAQELLHYIFRIRTSNDVRIALSHTYIPCKYLPALDVTILEGSLYEYLNNTHQIYPIVLDHNFSALLPSKKQQELLQVDSCALLKSSHTSTIEPDLLFEYTETYYAGSRYTYHFSRTN
ncbi:MAG: GntR family transcriptional regulator [Lachnospiraceae bacterium]|nr:GntR family transcriptional regulator [Lachnospiraceae bacterium]